MLLEIKPDLKKKPTPIAVMNRHAVLNYLIESLNKDCMEVSSKAWAWSDFSASQ